MKPSVLSIAGTDPSGGAGIQADLKAISATGSYAASVITVAVAQNTTDVQAIQALPTAFVRQQLLSVYQDLNFKAIKIGMIYSEEIINQIVDTLAMSQAKHIVIDPVMIAKNGAPLLKKETMAALKNKLLSKATLLTPNIPEAEALLNTTITSKTQMQQAAKSIAKQYQTNVLLKGGHLASTSAADLLYQYQSQQQQWFEQPRIDTKNTHGTGCTLSAAIASFLAQDNALAQAIDKAKYYLTEAIKAGRYLQVGKGYGPVDHFYYLYTQETWKYPFLRSHNSSK